jgi:hypothetical protein
MIPVPFGYKVSVEIARNIETNIATVFVHAPMYKNKVWEMSRCYSASQFSDYQIINDRDFITVMCKHFPSDS